MEIYFKKENSLIKMGQLLEIKKYRDEFILVTSSLDRHDEIILLAMTDEKKTKTMLAKICDVIDEMMKRRESGMIISITETEEKEDSGNK